MSRARYKVFAALVGSATPLTLHDIARLCDSTYGSLSPLVRGLVGGGLLVTQEGPRTAGKGPGAYRYALSDRGFERAVQEIEEGRAKYGGPSLVDLRRQALQERVLRIGQEISVLEAERTRHEQELVSLETVSAAGQVA